MYRGNETGPEGHSDLFGFFQRWASSISYHGAATALEGLEELVKLANQAPGSITIMPGSGINPDNIAKIKARSKTNELHASASKVISAEDTKATHLGFVPKTTKATCGETIRRLKAVIGD